MKGLPWIKAPTDYYSDPRVVLIKKMSGGSDILLIYDELRRMAGDALLADGVMRLEGAPLNDEMIAIIFGHTTVMVRQALSVLEQFGFISMDNGLIKLLGWEAEQNIAGVLETRKANSLRQAKHRERQKALPGARKTAIAAKKEAVLAFHSEHPKASQREIAEATGASQASVSRWLSACDSEGDSRFDSQIDSRFTDSHDSESILNRFTGDSESIQNQVLNQGVNQKSPALSQFGVDLDLIQATSHVTVSDKDIDVDVDESSSSTSNRTCIQSSSAYAPTLAEVEAFVGRMNLPISAKRFFEVNEARGWVTKGGKPIDDWRRLAQTWAAHERSGESPEGKRDGADKAGGVDEAKVARVMAEYRVDRVEALELIAEDLV